MTDETRKLLAAGYMESEVPFRCETCAYASRAPRGAGASVPSGRAGFCSHPRVLDVVDARLGCCNHFVPKKRGAVLFGRPF